jgi:hypothetical protein
VTTALAPATAPAVREPYVNWRPPLVWTAVVVRVGGGHMLLRQFPKGVVLVPGSPVLGDRTPSQAALQALRGPGSEQLILRPVLIDERQLARRKVIVHTFVSEPLSRRSARELRPADNRSNAVILPRKKALQTLPARARLRTQFALATPEFHETAVLEWHPWRHPDGRLGMPAGWPPAGER